MIDEKLRKLAEDLDIPVEILIERLEATGQRCPPLGRRRRSRK
jgi:hypothetical protein